jgi:multiple sugar transport system permease protein
MAKKKSVAHIVYYILLTIFALMIIIPFIWLLFTSFDKFKTYSLPYPPRMIPKQWTLFNYRMAIMNVSILKYLLNTVILVVMSAVLNIFFSTLTGFVLSKGRFPGRTFLLLFFMTNLMIPFETKLMPMYSVIRMLHLSNNFLGVIIPSFMANAMYIFFVKQYCDDLPSDMYEAGVIDGASKFTIFRKIFLPLMGAIIATIAVLDVIAVWNDLLWPMIVLTDNRLSTIQLGLIRYTSNSTGAVHAGITTALSIMSIVPLAIVFTFLQKYIVQSVAATGLKQ